MLDQLKALVEKLKGTDQRCIGVDIGVSSVKMATVSGSSKAGWTLESFVSLALPSGLVQSGEVTDPRALGAILATGLEKLNTKHQKAAVGLAGPGVVVRKAAVQKMDDSLLMEQIKFEAEQYVPFDLTEASLDYYALSTKPGPDLIDVLIVAGKQDQMLRLMESVDGAGMSCEVIDVSGFALFNCYEANYGIPRGNIAILNIGAGMTTMVAVQNGEVALLRDLPVGSLNHTYEIHRSMGISIAEAETLKVSASLGQQVPSEVHNLISAANEVLCEELRSAAEYTKSALGASVDRYVLTGGGLFIPGMIDSIGRVLGTNPEIFNPLEKIKASPQVLADASFDLIKVTGAVALGLAFRSAGDR